MEGGHSGKGCESRKKVKDFAPREERDKMMINLEADFNREG
jgi:hypothetical protein